MRVETGVVRRVQTADREVRERRGLSTSCHGTFNARLHKTGLL